MKAYATYATFLFNVWNIHICHIYIAICSIYHLLFSSFHILLFSLFSQSGLKKFLAQYPAIFVIDGEHVLVNSFEPTVKDDPYGAGGRDYIQESRDYFKHKLLQYGIGTEVPIKSLLGHRSQASPQIRHISGKFTLQI